MRSIGIDRLVVSKMLNHAEAGITRVYDRYAADPEKVTAMERWANRLREIISPARSRQTSPPCGGQRNEPLAGHRSATLRGREG